MAGITEKQRRFVDEYLIDLNGTQAAIRAGYSEATANEQASRMLANVNIQEYLQERRKAVQERTEITQDKVLKELAKIGFADIRKAVKWSPTMGETIVGEDVVQTNGVLLISSDDLDDETAAAISEVSQTKDGIKIKFHDKKGALVDIGRHLGMFDDKLRLIGDKNQPIQHTHKVEFEVLSGNVPRQTD